MTLIMGKIVVLDAIDTVIAEENLGTNEVDIDTTNVLSLVEVTPILGKDQVIDTFTYVLDKANNICQKVWTVKQLGPTDFPLTPSQLRLGLIRNGIPLTTITSLIGQLPTQQLKDEAMVWWEYSPTIHWEHPETQLLMGLLGVPILNLQAMWMVAKDYT